MPGRARRPVGSGQHISQFSCERVALGAAYGQSLSYPGIFRLYGKRTIRCDQALLEGHALVTARGKGVVARLAHNTPVKVRCLNVTFVHNHLPFQMPPISFLPYCELRAIARSGLDPKLSPAAVCKSCHW